MYTVGGAVQRAQIEPRVTELEPSRFAMAVDMNGVEIVPFGEGRADLRHSVAQRVDDDDLDVANQIAQQGLPIGDPGIDKGDCDWCSLGHNDRIRLQRQHLDRIAHRSAVEHEPLLQRHRAGAAAHQSANRPGGLD